MSPFAWMANVLIDLLPEGASELAVGSAALLGIFLVLAGLFVFAAGLAWLISRVL